MKDKLRSQISIATLLTVSLTLIGGTAVAVGTAMTYVNTQIAPIQAEVDTNTVDIAQINTNLTWIKGALQARGFSPDQSTTTNYQ
jgi:hypothetical protein